VSTGPEQTGKPAIFRDKALLAFARERDGGDVPPADVPARLLRRWWLVAGLLTAALLTVALLTVAAWTAAVLP
jgi:hypothetical protein